MPALKILPGNIANMIAAGEVVQRPASVIKELMENAIDAGATSVSVFVKDAGRTMIQVIDNGCGMSPADAVLCFERHATSKISTAEDLNDIMTYGFRGEALPSIASVAEITLKTRRPVDEIATQVKITGYNHCETSQTSAPVGTNISVRNLFYNTPARRKFLKSDTVESRHIVEEFERVALTRPEIAFTLNANGRDLFVLKPAKSLKFRISDIAGATLASELVDISTETSVMKVEGFVGRPDAARKTPGNQFFFVNGRYFRSNYLHKAVIKAYEGYIPEGVNPSYFLYLQIDPHSIDINIHPTKTEVKFEDDSLLFQILYACIKETLGRNSFGADIDFDSASEVKLPVFGSNFDQYHDISMPVADFDPNYNPFEQDAPANEGSPQSQSSGPKDEWSTKSFPAGGYKAFVDPHQDYGKLFEEQALPSTKVLILQGRYILTPVKSGVMVVNIRRARERVLYENFLRGMEGTGRVSQSSLFPVQVNVGVEGRLLLDANADMLHRLGFEFSPFGNDSVVVTGVPEGYSGEEGSIREMMSDLLVTLSDETANLKEIMDSAMALKLCRLGSSRPVTSPVEAQALIDRLLGCENAEFTAAGQRVITIISTDEIDKKF